MHVALRRGVLGVACALATACASLSSPPHDGRYAGELCVSQAAAPASCGPARLTLANDVVLVQVSDLAYRLFLKGDQLDLVLMHGAAQVDAFSAAYAWQGPQLHFSDTARSVRYGVQFRVFEGGIP